MFKSTLYLEDTCGFKYVGAIFTSAWNFDSYVSVDIKKLYLTLKQTEQIVHIETSDVILTIFDARNK